LAFNAAKAWLRSGSDLANPPRIVIGRCRGRPEGQCSGISIKDQGAS
jgi:hypothetical protein